MKDINNFIDNITNSETYVTKWLLHNLIKSKGYRFEFTVRDAANTVSVTEVYIRSAISKLAIAEAVTWKKISIGKIQVSVFCKPTFHALVKKLEVR